MGPQIDSGNEPVPILRLENLSKHFGGERALDHVSLSIAPGEIHGLLGQNGSGKSTLIKVLAGVHIPDPGARIEVAGHPLPLPLPAGSFRKYGLSFVHQHLALVPSLTVAENLFVGRYATQSRLWVNGRADESAARKLLAEYEIPLSPDRLVKHLLPVERALLAIVRAMYDLRVDAEQRGHGGLLILDEPTPFLPRHDVQTLFRLMREVARRGASVIFVSHDVDEVMDITDRATILRDGRVVDTLDIRNTQKTDLIEGIVGRPVSEIFRESSSSQRDELLAEVQGVGGTRSDGVHLRLDKGEIVGLTGLVGSGYDEVPYLMYGVGAGRQGDLLLDGQRWPLRQLNPQRALNLGMVLIPGDRPTQGGVLDLSVLDNMTLPVLDLVWRGWKIDWSRLRVTGQQLLDAYQVKPRRQNVLLGNLSGGNQQKVVLAKWLQTGPRLILLDEPTQGVDVGAREEVYAVVRQAAAGGAGIICASSDHEQLAALCDRVLIFRQGEVAHELNRPFTKEQLSHLCYVESEASPGRAP